MTRVALLSACLLALLDAHAMAQVGYPGSERSRDSTWQPRTYDLNGSVGGGDPTAMPLSQAEGTIVRNNVPTPAKPKSRWVFMPVNGSYCQGAPVAVYQTYTLTCADTETNETRTDCGAAPAVAYRDCMVYYTGQGTCDARPDVPMYTPPAQAAQYLVQSAFVPATAFVNAGPYSFAAGSKAWNSPYCPR